MESYRSFSDKYDLLSGSKQSELVSSGGSPGFNGGRAVPCSSAICIGRRRAPRQVDGCRSVSQTRFSSLATFILIHGAFFGGWCWDGVVNRLVALGHSVHAPTLTGLAERRHLRTAETDLLCHIEDVVMSIDAVEEPRIVLVGHSYGGMPVMGAADARAGRIAALVFLDAAVPQTGETLLSIRNYRRPGRGRTFGYLPQKAQRLSRRAPKAMACRAIWPSRSTTG